MLLKQSTARNRMVLLIQSADHITGLTGATLTITASKNGAAFASITPTVTERGSGWYSLALTTGHTDTLGDIALHITSASADPLDVLDQVVLDVPGSSVASIGTGGIVAASFAAGAIDNASIATDAIASAEIAATAVTKIAAGVLTSTLTEVYPADGAEGTLSSLVYLILSALTQYGITATTLTARKLDGTTAAAVYTLDDATNPTTRTRSG